jgi:hypothetical protein
MLGMQSMADGYLKVDTNLKMGPVMSDISMIPRNIPRENI